MALFYKVGERKWERRANLDHQTVVITVTTTVLRGTNPDSCPDSTCDLDRRSFPHAFNGGDDNKKDTTSPD